MFLLVSILKRPNQGQKRANQGRKRAKKSHFLVRFSRQFLVPFYKKWNKNTKIINT